jgi:hypothetical protein
MFVNNHDFNLTYVCISGETMNQQMKLTIRPKIESYVKRAEEIKEILKRGPTEKKAVADTVGAYGNSKDNIGDDDDSGDPEKKQMMQNFESTFHDR